MTARVDLRESSLFCAVVLAGLLASSCGDTTRTDVASPAHDQTSVDHEEALPFVDDVDALCSAAALEWFEETPREVISAEHSSLAGAIVWAERLNYPEVDARWTSELRRLPAQEVIVCTTRLAAIPAPGPPPLEDAEPPEPPDVVTFISFEDGVRVVSVGSEGPAIAAPSLMPNELLELPDHAEIVRTWTGPRSVVAEGSTWELVWRPHEDGFCVGLGNRPAHIRHCVPRELLDASVPPLAMEAVDAYVVAGIGRLDPASSTVELTTSRHDLEVELVPLAPIVGEEASDFGYFVLEIGPDEDFITAG